MEIEVDKVEHIMKIKQDISSLDASIRDDEDDSVLADFIEDEGHYFGTDLPDTDKQALIEFLKTF